MQLVTIVNMERDYSGSIVRVLLRTYDGEYKCFEIPAGQFIRGMGDSSYLKSKVRILKAKNKREAVLNEIWGAGELSFNIGDEKYKFNGVIL